MSIINARKERSRRLRQVQEIIRVFAARPDRVGNDIGDGLQRLRTQILFHVGGGDEDDDWDGSGNVRRSVERFIL